MVGLIELEAGILRVAAMQLGVEWHGHSLSAIIRKNPSDTCATPLLHWSKNERTVSTPQPTWQQGYDIKGNTEIGCGMEDIVLKCDRVTLRPTAIYNPRRPYKEHDQSKTETPPDM